MIRRKEVKGLSILLVSITVFFGLSSVGCKKESEKSGSTGLTTFTSPDDAANKTFGSLSAGPVNGIITGRMTGGNIITARIITGRIITARAPKLINDGDKIDILNLAGRLYEKTRLSKKEEFEFTCEDLKPKCVEGNVEKAECKKDQSTKRLYFDISVKDCKEIIDEQKGDYIISTGYAKGYVESSTKFSQNSFNANIISFIEQGESLIREFRNNKETNRVKTKSSGYKIELAGSSISGEKDIELKIGTKLSGSYSVNDEIGNKMEDYSFSDFAVELVIRGLNSGGEQQVDLQNIQIYVSINGKYSLNTTPDVDCIEGVFSFKTIKPIKSGGEGEGYCGIESGEIEVNNAKIEFSSGKVKVSVENQQKEYGCEEVEGLCKYEPIEIPQIEIIEEGGEEIVIVTCPVWFKDADKDGYTDGTTEVSCEKPSDEYISSQTAWDCDDNDPNINPGRTEICDNKDNNCNGQVDEGNVCDYASTFAKSIGGSNLDVAYSIIQSSDGGYIVAGETWSFGAGGSDFYVVKLDSAGNVVWTKTIGGSDDDYATSIIQSSDGGYVVAGETWSFGAGSSDFWVVKLDSSGNVQWTKTIGGSSGDYANSIIQSSDGGYVVVGQTNSFGENIFVVKLDSSGNVLWSKTISGSYYDFVRSIIQSSDGGYVVVGRTLRAGRYDMYIVKLDSYGDVVWTKTIGGDDDHDEAYSIIQSSDGGYVVAGYTESFGAGGSDFYVVKLDSSGNVQWTKTIGGSEKEVATSIIQSSDGGYVVAGFTESFGAGYFDIYVVKLDSSGNVQWTKTIIGRSSDDFPWSIIQSSDGGYVVAGHTYSLGAGGWDFYVVKMDANGNVCFSQNVTNYSVSSNVGSSSSPSATAFPQSPTVNTVSPTISYGGSVSDVCALAPAPHLRSANQDCGFSSAVATNKEDVKSYGYSAGGVLSRFLIPASMLIFYGQLRKKRKKKKVF
jgi:DNA replication initiation complex subunit (GINS family)